MPPNSESSLFLPRGFWRVISGVRFPRCGEFFDADLQSPKAIYSFTNQQVNITPSERLSAPEVRTYYRHVTRGPLAPPTPWFTLVASQIYANRRRHRRTFKGTG